MPLLQQVVAFVEPSGPGDGGTGGGQVVAHVRLVQQAVGGGLRDQKRSEGLSVFEAVLG